MKYLLVVAHPDDEVLGAGASMWKWSHDGDEVEVCIMCTEAKARAFRPSDAELEGDTDAAVSFLGVKKKYEGTFPNIEMNTVPHLKLVQFIEQAISRKRAGRGDYASSRGHQQRPSANVDGLSGSDSFVPASSGGETCEGVLVYGGAIVYGVEDQ